MAVAAFNYAAWAARYPEFAGVQQATAEAYFAEACLYLDNSDGSPVDDVARRLVLLNMVTAHIAALSGAGGRDGGQVGRVSSASEGSVSVSLDAGALPGSAAWYQQTQYGAGFWQATKSLRSGFYVPADPYVFERPVPGWRR
jgi:hypothetical protein